MKKILKMAAILAAACLMFVGCNQPAGGDKPADEKPVEKVFDGNVDLTKLAEYSEASGGLLAEFDVASDYRTVFKYKISDLGASADDGFAKICVIGKVFNGETEYDLPSAWSARLMLKASGAESYNCGVEDQFVDFKSVDDDLEICIKAEPVTKVVVTAIKFVK